MYAAVTQNLAGQRRFEFSSPKAQFFKRQVNADISMLRPFGTPVIFRNHNAKKHSNQGIKGRIVGLENRAYKIVEVHDWSAWPFKPRIVTTRDVRILEDEFVTGKRAVALPVGDAMPQVQAHVSSHGNSDINIGSLQDRRLIRWE